MVQMQAARPHPKGEIHMTRPTTITLDHLLEACADDGQTSAICIDTELVPIGGTGSPVNPAVYSGGVYQHDKRWENDEADKPADVIVIDNVPSQANRLEAALDKNASTLGLPRLVLDLSGDEFAHLPAHLPRRISSLRFPHRNADAYLRDALLDGVSFASTELGQEILTATTARSAALLAWFPQALLFGFWQSHLGKKRSQAKHARAWTSEIIGWHPAPATGDDPEKITPTRGTKGDPLNLQAATIAFKEEDLLAGWEYVEGKKSSSARGKKTDSMSNIGHGQVPFPDSELAPGAVSFKRITQKATCSFAQLRRVELGDEHNSEHNAAARAVLVALGLHAHHLAFGRGFELRSRADLIPEETRVRMHRGPDLSDLSNTNILLKAAVEHASGIGVPLDGWNVETVALYPNKSLTNAIRGSWPALDTVDADGSER